MNFYTESEIILLIVDEKKYRKRFFLSYNGVENTTMVSKANNYHLS